MAQRHTGPQKNHSDEKNGDETPTKKYLGSATSKPCILGGFIFSQKNRLASILAGPVGFEDSGTEPRPAGQPLSRLGRRISEILIENWRIWEIFMENWRNFGDFHGKLENFGDFHRKFGNFGGFGEISIEFRRISKICRGFSRILELWASPKPLILLDSLNLDDFQ